VKPPAIPAARTHRGPARARRACACAAPAPARSAQSRIADRRGRGLARPAGRRSDQRPAYAHPPRPAPGGVAACRRYRGKERSRRGWTSCSRNTSRAGNCCPGRPKSSTHRGDTRPTRGTPSAKSTARSARHWRVRHAPRQPPGAADAGLRDRRRACRRPCDAAGGGATAAACDSLRPLLAAAAERWQRQDPARRRLVCACSNPAA
jgi:hypothetical protein